MSALLEFNRISGNTLQIVEHLLVKVYSETVHRHGKAYAGFGVDDPYFHGIHALRAFDKGRYIMYHRAVYVRYAECHHHLAGI